MKLPTEMKSMAASTLLILSLVTVQAQPKNSNSAGFKNSLANLEQEIAAWQQIADHLKPEDLTISYADGKLVDQQLSVVKQNLQLASMLSTRILRTGRLSDEINLMAVLGDLGQGFREISNILLSLNPKDDETGRKISAQAHLFSDIPNGKLNDLFLETYHFVMSRADQIEHMNCNGGTNQ